MGQTLNMDVRRLCDQVNRYIKEVQKSASANVSMTSEFDLVRYKTYLSALRALIEHLDVQSPLDLPETNPSVYEVEDGPELLQVENENIKHLCLMLATARDELIMSHVHRFCAV